MKTKTVYIANDGTEHDSPQAAARSSLEQAIMDIAVEWDQGDDTIRAAQFYADYPEALRDAVNAYFEALEEHPDVIHNPYLGSCSGDHFSPACIDPNCWLPRDGGPLDPDSIDVRVSEGTDELEGEIAPGVRGFEMVIGTSHTNHMDYASSSDWSAGAVVHNPDGTRVNIPLGTYQVRNTSRFEMVAPPGVQVPSGTAVAFTAPPQGDPSDPTTWRADLPADHPNYCRPFGTRGE